ncbi:hypothetical protein ACWCSD_00140 [Nonomuraea sp. NPDC001684]
MYKKVLATAASVILALALTPADPAAAKPVVSIVEGYSATVKENDSSFFCPQNEVLIGRAHHGDENGHTTYWCGKIWIDRTQVAVSTNHYQLVDPETYSWFEAPESNAMVGREHDGDENGISVAYFAMLTYLGRPVTLVNKRWSETYTEESHESKANPGEIMTGRKHFGDENGDTEYQYAVVTYY